MGEMRPFTICWPSRGEDGVWNEYTILAPYDHVIDQLAAEISLSTRYDSHESRRRAAYAKQVLDLFADEYEKFEGDLANFYSKILTPLLARWLRGVYDGSSETVRAVVARGKESATLDDATRFYLKINLTDPKYIPMYRRQLLNLPITRWHLAITRGIIPFHNQGKSYMRFFNNHNRIMASRKPGTPVQFDERGIALLNGTEAAVAVAEQLENVFYHELRASVRIDQFYSADTI